jgi:prepilin-type processing-associated H-X9-DG protein
MTHTTLADQPTEAAATRQPPADGRWSVRVFAVGVLAALPVLLWFGRDHWFYLDEFQILGADGRSNTGYLDGHSGHWITLLRLEYRLNFELWASAAICPTRYLPSSGTWCPRSCCARSAGGSELGVGSPPPVRSHSCPSVRDARTPRSASRSL